jgi:hypothetical protein
MERAFVRLALSELILDGRYSAMDLTRMSYRRILNDEPYREKGII